jgi:hypothetical protein
MAAAKCTPSSRVATWADAACRCHAEPAGGCGVELDLVLNAARRSGASKVVFGGYAIFFSTMWRQQQNQSKPQTEPTGNSTTSKQRRSARRNTAEAYAARQLKRRCAAQQQQQHQKQLSDSQTGAGGQQAASTAAMATAAAATATATAAAAAARRVRWAPILVALREIEVPAAEVLAKQQAWQAVEAGEPEPEAALAVDADDASALEAQAEVEARRAVRTETGKRQALWATQPNIGVDATDKGVAVGLAPPAPAVTRGRARGLDVRPDAPRVRRPGKGKARAPAISTADVLAWAAAHRAARGL